VRLVALGPAAGAWALAAGAGAIFLVANIVPRTLVAKVLFIEAINRYTMYGQLSPTEGFQYYGFPLLGLLLLVACLCVVIERRPTTIDAAPLAAA
jgi:hypothetical protein